MSTDSSISADGRVVAFYSRATNLVAGDRNGERDIFVRDVQTGETTRVSLSSAGEEANGNSLDPSISADGQFVAFRSFATDLVADDTNEARDIFVHDLQAGQTTRVSVNSDGEEANDASFGPSISADGQVVAFRSFASNLVADDTNGKTDIFVRDVQTGETTRVSVSSAGVEGDDDSREPAISDDGRFVAFFSRATNLVEDDTNFSQDVFVHDLQAGETTRVSLNSNDEEANNPSANGLSISADGRFVSFASLSDNLVPGDSNDAIDVFVRDRQTGETTRVSINSAAAEGNDGSERPSMSADGRFVAFDSEATNLVDDDTNEAHDIFLHDRQTGQTERVSVSSAGAEGNDRSVSPSLSDDGSFVAFRSQASNLVDDDTNGVSDVFVRDRGG